MTGQEKVYVGYNPIITVDAQDIIRDYAGNGYVLHVVRNPFSAYADRKKRPTRQSVAHYALAWQVCIQEAEAARRKHPDHCFILRYEDIIANPRQVLGGMLGKMGLGDSASLEKPSWNGKALEQVYPWGTIRIPTAEVNLATGKELSTAEIGEMFERLEPVLQRYDYLDFHRQLSH